MNYVSDISKKKKNASKLKVDDIEHKSSLEIYELLLKQKSRNVYIRLPNGKRVYSLFDNLITIRQAINNKRNLPYQDKVLDIRNAYIEQGEEFIDPAVKEDWDNFVKNNTDIMVYSYNMEVFTNLLKKVYKTEPKDYEMLSKQITKYQNSNQTLSRSSFISSNEDANREFYESQLADTLTSIAYFLKDKKGVEFVNYILDKGNLSYNFTVEMKKYLQDLNSKDFESENE